MRAFNNCFRLLIIITYISIVLLSSCNDPEISQITIIHTNDLHGYIMPGNDAVWEKKVGGFATFSSWVKRIRHKNQLKNIPTLLVDAGDFFMGSLEGSLTKGKAIVDLYNLLKYDATTFGNHEFDFGIDNLKKLSEITKFPFIVSNLYESNSNKEIPFIKPYLFKSYEDLKVAIIGVTTEETPKISMPQNVEKLFFKNPIITIKSYQKILKDPSIQLHIVLSHLGVDMDKQLAKEIPEIDVIIGGHTHDLLKSPVKSGNAIICQTGSRGRYAGKLDLWIDRDDNKIIKNRYELFTNIDGSYPPDPEVVKLIDKIKRSLGDIYNKKIGTTFSTIYTSKEKESSLGDLITDSIRDKSGAQIAFQNSYGIRSSIIKGDIRYQDVFEILPFENTIITMELSGRQIKELLEESFSLNNGMLQVSGLIATYNLNNPAGQRLVNLTIDDKSVNDEDYYLVATNNFLASGGDNFDVFLKGKSIRDTKISLRDAFIEYIKNQTELGKNPFTPSRLISE